MIHLNSSDDCDQSTSESSKDLRGISLNEPYRDPSFELSVRSFNEYLVHSNTSNDVDIDTESHLLSNAISNRFSFNNRINEPTIIHQSIYDPEYESNLAFQSRPFTKCQSQLYQQVFSNEIFKQTIQQQTKDKYERQRPLYEKFGLQNNDQSIQQSNITNKPDESKSNSSLNNPIKLSKEQRQINQLYKDLYHTTQSMNQMTDVAIEVKNRYRVKPVDRKQWTAIFHSINQSKSGFLTIIELKKAFKTLSMKLSSNEVSNLMRIIDSNFDDRISLPEFIAALSGDNDKEWEGIQSMRQEKASRVSASITKPITRQPSIQRPQTAPSTRHVKSSFKSDRLVTSTKTHTSDVLPVSLWAPAWARHANVESIINREAREKQERSLAHSEHNRPSSPLRRASIITAHTRSMHSLNEEDVAAESECVSTPVETLQEQWKRTQEQALSMRIGREIAAAQAWTTRPATADPKSSQPSSTTVLISRARRERRFMSAINECAERNSSEVKIIGMKPIDLNLVSSARQSDSQSLDATNSPSNACIFETHLENEVDDVLLESDAAISQIRSVDGWFVEDCIDV